MAEDQLSRSPENDDPAEPPWPPEIAPAESPCSTCQYDLAGLAVEKPEGIVLCPECGMRTWIRKSGEDASLLHQFDIRCVNESGESYVISMVAASHAEASQRVSTEGHALDPSWRAKEAAAVNDSRGAIFAALAGACSLPGMCAWQAAAVGVVLAGCAMMASDGKRGRVSMAMAIMFGAMGVALRLVP